MEILNKLNNQMEKLNKLINWMLKLSNRIEKINKLSNWT